MTAKRAAQRPQAAWPQPQAEPHCRPASWDLTWADGCVSICAVDFVNTAPEGHQGQLPALPQWRGAKAVSVMRSSEPPSNRQHRAPAQRRAGLEKGHRGSPPAGCPSPTGLTLGASAQRPGRSRVAAEAGRGARLSTQAALAPQQAPAEGNSRTGEASQQARVLKAVGPLGLPRDAVNKAAPQDHRPPPPNSGRETGE